MKQLVIMPGGFHPFHAGHLALYQSALQAFPGADVKVAATNDTSSRPFPFKLKEKLAQLAGVPPGDFYQVKSPFRADEITKNYDPADTQLIFVRSEKDANKPPQPGGILKNGSPAYLQPLSNNMEPMTRHAYMAYLPTVTFGPGMQSATEIRTAWPELDERRRMALVMSLYPHTQKNPKLAKTVVKMLDTAMGTEVAEAFDNPYKTKTEKSEYGDVDMLAKLPDGTNLSIMFNHEGDNEWQVEFYRDNSQEVTGQGDAQRIFATVLAAIQKFVKKYQPDVIKFSAEKSNNSDSRSSLYDRLVSRFAQQLGYDDYSEEYMNSTMYELSKQSQGVDEEVTRQMSQGGLRASYQAKYNQPMMEDYLDEARS